MKGEYTTERERTMSQKRDRKWIGVIVIEVVERKNGMGIDVNEWIENIDANMNEKQE